MSESLECVLCGKSQAEMTVHDIKFNPFNCGFCGGALRDPSQTIDPATLKIPEEFSNQMFRDMPTATFKPVKISVMDGKSQAWRDAADKLLEALARENKYLVADIVILFLESAGYGLKNYSALGGVFKRAAKKGMIKQVRKTKNQILWVSNVYGDSQDAKD